MTCRLLLKHNAVWVVIGELRDIRGSRDEKELYLEVRDLEKNRLLPWLHKRFYTPWLRETWRISCESGETFEVEAEYLSIVGDVIGLYVRSRVHVPRIGASSVGMGRIRITDLQ